jgi:hypothetical protein
VVFLIHKAKAQPLKAATNVAVKFFPSCQIPFSDQFEIRCKAKPASACPVAFLSALHLQSAFYLGNSPLTTHC